MLNNAHLLLLACAFVSCFDYYSVCGSSNKDFLINLPKIVSSVLFFLSVYGIKAASNSDLLIRQHS